MTVHGFEGLRQHQHSPSTPPPPPAPTVYQVQMDMIHWGYRFPQMRETCDFRASRIRVFRCHMVVPEHSGKSEKTALTRSEVSWCVIEDKKVIKLILKHVKTWLFCLS